MELLLLQAGGNAGMLNLVFIGGMIAIFWLFLIRPSTKTPKRTKKHFPIVYKKETKW
jgi:preprotein translocase subunit YajC